VRMIHPPTKAAVPDALRAAERAGERLLIVGGRRHLDKGNAVDVDAELWMTQLDRVVDYEPAEMVAVVEAGVRVGELQRTLAGAGQEWPCDAPPEATVGGVIASGAISPRRLRVGAVRDTVLEVELVTGDGRLLRGGARTVKNVAGYDLPKLAAGSLGTLGAIVQVALKLRPLPQAVRSLVATNVDGLALGSDLLAAVPRPAAVVATDGRVELRLEGWSGEIAAQADAARAACPELVQLEDGAPFPARRPWEDGAVLVEAAVPPSRIGALLEGIEAPWGALLGVGIVWVGLPAGPPGEAQLASLRARAMAFTGVAPVVRGPGGLGPDDAAIDIKRRVKAAFDPSGVLAPGRGWGGI
jgi:glycolate oxidase FAD binding subunit